MGPLHGVRTRPPPLPYISQPPEKTKTGREESSPFSSEQSSQMFYPDKVHNSSQTEGKCQISLLLNHPAKTIQSPPAERPWHLSAKPQVVLNFSPVESRYLVPFHRVGNSPGSFQPAPNPGSFDRVGISPPLSTEPHSRSRP